MQRYDLSPSVRDALTEHSRLVQGAIATLANRRLGQKVEPDGIMKCEGGVRVNGREIAIKADYVIDDWSKPLDPTPEESAVVAAIREVAERWQAVGPAALHEFKAPLSGDPLRSMFRL